MEIKTHLKKLSCWLKDHNKVSLAQQILDLSEFDDDDYIAEDYKSRLDENPISEEEYLKENFRNLPKKRSWALILEKENFHPIDTSTESLINSGGFGHIFRGVYQNKPAVAKVETNLDSGFSLHEVENWQNILSIKNKLPPELQIHIPEIYYVNRDKIQLNDDIISYQITIMEELYPLNDHLRDVLTAGRAANPYLQEHFEEKKLEIAEKIHKSFSEKYFTVDISLQQIFNALSKIKIKRNNIRESGKVFANNLEIYFKKYSDNLRREFTYLFTDIVIDILRLDKTSRFPTDTPTEFEIQNNEKYEFFENAPETKSFYQLLFLLHNEYDFDWQDLHSGNIMQNKDGVPKFIDIGLWNLDQFTK